MSKLSKFLNINMSINILGLLYYYIYISDTILFLYLYYCIYNIVFVNGLHYFIRNTTRITERPEYIPSNLEYLFNISKSGIIEMITILICNKQLSNNISYDLLTFIPKSFVYEIVFDFFHYWTHRISHYKYLYYFHKTHHKQTDNISVFSTYNHNLIDLLISNVLPMYLTSCIIPLYETQFFIFLLFKTFIEISGHAGTHIKNSSFSQCFWIPKLFGIELYCRDHFIHHAKFKYNYGKRFTIWDKAFGTYKTDSKIIEKEQQLFNKTIININNNYIKYSLLSMFICIGYFI